MTQPKKKITRKERIIKYLLRKQKDGKFIGTTCQDITRHIIKAEGACGNVALYMSGSVSTKLQELIKAGRVELVPGVTTDRGGKIYRYKDPN